MLFFILMPCTVLTGDAGVFYINMEVSLLLRCQDDCWVFTWRGWRPLSSLTSSRSKWLQQSEARRLWQQKKDKNARERKVVRNCFRTCIILTETDLGGKLGKDLPSLPDPLFINFWSSGSNIKTFLVWMVVVQAFSCVVVLSIHSVSQYCLIPMPLSYWVRRLSFRCLVLSPSFHWFPWSFWLASKHLLNWWTMMCQFQIASILSINLGDFQFLWEICDSIRWHHSRPKGSQKSSRTGPRHILS